MFILYKYITVTSVIITQIFLSTVSRKQITKILTKSSNNNYSVIFQHYGTIQIDDGCDADRRK